ncbi:hypothetical protein HYALB_00006932 [Hymenoscyphus albidus]|uniref:Tetrapyrrole biosynthesis uroporphyrinogen III synthase domain-containing protein n=1 Tax=Hymenoscyphus albidus TaxID=595503 RepID=A0A9N9LEW7_9HELO|nr:hypothetical protein HYALB_00006932 [Hymenoscyphus albidus]
MSNKIPILLLKTKSIPNDGYQEHFSSSKDDLQFDPIFVPVLEHQLLEDGMSVVRGLLQKKSISKEEGAKYGGMIFTSQRAVEAFAKLIEEGKGEESWPHLQDIPTYTVGPATSRALRSIPQTPPLKIFGSETGNGEALAHYMLDHYGEWYKDRTVKPPLLFLVGEQRRDIIPKTLMDPELPNERRIQVDELVVYGTGVMESFAEDFKRVLGDTEGSDMRWVVVFSPTGCEAMLRVLGLLDQNTGRVKVEGDTKSGRSKTYVITIGPTTRDFLRDSFGFEPDVCAEKPSPEGLRDGIVKFISNLESN